MNHQRILAWAETHIDRFEALARAFADKNPVVLVTRHDNETGEQVVTVKVRRLPIMDEWVFAIGDALHNMRVALDYLAFQIVAPSPSNPGLVRRTQFPICHHREDWPALARRRLPGVSDEVCDAFEALQPYHGRFGDRLEPLAVLDALENIHKHRHPLDAFPAITSRGFVGDAQKVHFTSSGLPTGPLGDGAELYRYVFKDPADTKTKLQFVANLRVCFDRSGPARGQIVLTALNDICSHIRDDVFPTLEKFIPAARDAVPENSAESSYSPPNERNFPQS